MTARAARKPRAKAVPPAQPAAPLFAIATDTAAEAPPAVVPAIARAIVVTVEFGMYGAHSKPQAGALWRASFYDALQSQFYAGSADDPWEAIGWALYERELRIANHNHPTMTRAGNETPLQALARLRGER